MRSKKVVERIGKFKVTESGLEWVSSDDNTKKLTERKSSISRFKGSNEFTDKEFLEALKALIPHMNNGIINLDISDDISVTEKMDSNYSAFGINEKGKFFLESSNSGEVTEDDYRSRFSYLKDFHDSFESLSQNEVLQKTLRNIYKSFGPIKFEAEIFPTITHMGNENGEIVFNSTKYNKKKLGKDGAFMVFRSSIKQNGNWIESSPKINNNLIKKLKNADSSLWRIYYVKDEGQLSGVIKFDTSGFKDFLNEEKIQEAIEILSSNNGNIQKKHLSNVIGELRARFQSVLDNYANNIDSVLGSEGRSPVEGIVMEIRLPDGGSISIKGTSEVFDEIRSRTWETRSQITQLKKNLEDSILKEVLGLRTSQPAALNSDIKRAAEGASDSDEIISNFIEISKVSEPNIKSAIHIIRDVIDNLENIKNGFEVSKTELDPDTIRKTERDLEHFKKKIELIIDSIKTSNISEIVKVILAHRFEKFGGLTESKIIEMYEETLEPERTPVIIWSGRAQPWHKGHDSLIQFAKTKLEEKEAEKILIIPVEGEETSKDLETNPLSFDERKELINSVYLLDTQIIVSNLPAKNGHIGMLAEIALHNNCFISGWVMGSDRAEDFTAQLISTNNHMGQLKEEYPQEFDVDELNIKTDETGSINPQDILIVVDRNEIEEFNNYDQITTTQEPVISVEQMSGKLARDLVAKTDFESWYKEVVPPLYKEVPEVKLAYQYAYNKIQYAKTAEAVQEAFKRTETIRKLLKETFGLFDEEVADNLDKAIEKEINKGTISSEDANKIKNFIKSKQKQKERVSTLEVKELLKSGGQDYEFTENIIGAINHFTEVANAEIEYSDRMGRELIADRSDEPEEELDDDESEHITSEIVDQGIPPEKAARIAIKIGDAIEGGIDYGTLEDAIEDQGITITPELKTAVEDKIDNEEKSPEKEIENILSTANLPDDVRKQLAEKYKELEKLYKDPKIDKERINKVHMEINTLLSKINDETVKSELQQAIFTYKEKKEDKGLEMLKTIGKWAGGAILAALFKDNPEVATLLGGTAALTKALSDIALKKHPNEYQNKDGSPNAKKLNDAINNARAEIFKGYKGYQQNLNKMKETYPRQKEAIEKEMQNYLATDREIEEVMKDIRKDENKGFTIQKVNAYQLKKGIFNAITRVAEVLKAGEKSDVETLKTATGMGTDFLKQWKEYVKTFKPDIAQSLNL